MVNATGGVEADMLLIVLSPERLGESKDIGWRYLVGFSMIAHSSSSIVPYR